MSQIVYKGDDAKGPDISNVNDHWHSLKEFVGNGKIYFVLLSKSRAFIGEKI